MNRDRRQQLQDPGARSLFRRSVLVAFGQGSTGLLFITYIVAARTLGDAGFGEFTFGLTIATLLVMFPTWGSSRYSSIRAAREPGRTDEILGDYLGLTVPLTLLYFPLVFLVGHLASGNPTVVWVAVLLGGDLLAREFGNLLRLLLRVHDEYPLETLTGFGERGAILVLALAVLILWPDPVLLAAAFVGGRVVGVLVTAALYRVRVGPIRIRFVRGALRELFVGGTPVALRRGLNLVTFRVDMMFLGAMRPPRELGWYGSIYTIMDGVVMLPNPVNGSIGPTLSANFGEARLDVVTRLYQRGLKYLVVVGVLLTALFAILAAPLVNLVYGETFQPAAAALTILAFSIVFLLVRSLATEVLDNVDLRGASARIFALALLFNVALNILLIPRYGYLGAAASTVVTEAWLMGAMVWALRTAGFPARLLAQVRGPLLSIVVPAGLMWFLIDTPFLASLLGSLVYLAGLFVFRTWDDKDLDVFRGVWGRLTERSRTPG